MRPTEKRKEHFRAPNLEQPWRSSAFTFTTGLQCQTRLHTPMQCGHPMKVSTMYTLTYSITIWSPHMLMRGWFQICWLIKDTHSGVSQTQWNASCCELSSVNLHIKSWLLVSGHLLNYTTRAAWLLPLWSSWHTRFSKAAQYVNVQCTSTYCQLCLILSSKLCTTSLKSASWRILSETLASTAHDNLALVCLKSPYMCIDA